MYRTPPLRPPTQLSPTATWRPPVDGLDTGAAALSDVEIPGRLVDALVRLRLLDGVPLAYLVPDPALLPPESMRVVHVDPTWTDRLVEGALAAGRVGSLDLGFTAAVIGGIRQHLDEVLELRATLAWRRLLLLEEGKEATPTALLADGRSFTWAGRLPGGPPPLTGLLFRSQAVARWPELRVRAWSVRGQQPPPPPAEQTVPAPGAKDAVPVLRRARLGDDLLLVLFAGVPQRLEVEEPPTGVRFGVEGNAAPYTVRGREAPCDGVVLDVTLAGRRVLQIDEENIKVQSGDHPGKEHPARASQWFAWWFLQPPYTQVFTSAHAEREGSQAPPETLKLRRGRRVVPYLPSRTR